MTKIPKNEELDKTAKIAIICLDGAVSVYSETLEFIAWKLRHEKINVIRFGCSSMLWTCTSINSEGFIELTEQDRFRICERCRAGQRSISTGVIFEINDEDGVINEKSVLFLEELSKRLFSKGKVSDVLDMEYNGLPLCRIAFFDFSILAKVGPEADLDVQLGERFIAGVRDLMTLLHAFERFWQLHVVTHIIYVNGNYTQNTLARYFFAKKGVICLSMEMQPTSQHVLNRVMIADDRMILHPEGLFNGEVTRLPFNGNNVQNTLNVLKHFGARIEGSDFNAYTTLDEKTVAIEEVDLLGRFLKKYNRIHSFFLSSEDELLPHIVTHGNLQGQDPNLLGPYRTQMEFTSYFLKQVSHYPEIGFIIRLHPRMAKNKRDHFESKEHIRYKNLLAESALQENILILRGDSKISSYYLVSISDLVVISWSTIGLEALLLGVPVISAFPYHLMYPLSLFSCQPTNQLEMKKALFSISHFGKSEDTKLLAWISMAFEGQFFATTAHRGKGGISGKIYRISYRLSKIIRSYDLLAWTVNFLFLRNIVFDHKYLFRMKDEHLSKILTQTGLSEKLIKKYRDKSLFSLKCYGNRLALHEDLGDLLDQSSSKNNL